MKQREVSVQVFMMERKHVKGITEEMAFTGAGKDTSFHAITDFVTIWAGMSVDTGAVAG